MSEHRVLIGIESYLGDRLGRLKQTVNKLNKLLKVISVSSIYELDRTQDERFAGGLTAAMVGVTEMSSDKLLLALKGLELQVNDSTRCVDIDLLFFDNETIMTPVLTLPHPELHRRPQVLIPAAEIWGDHVHPVLEMTLMDLTKRFEKVKWGQFYSSGKTLLEGVL